MSELQRVGPIQGGAGSPVPFTAGVTGASRVQESHGRRFGPAVEGRVFILDSASVTLASANVTKSAMGTAAFINGFYNPVNSGKNVSILRAVVATVSGTPGGPFFYNHYLTSANVSSASTGTIRPSILTNSAGQSVCRPLVNVVLATTPADTTALLQTATVGGPAAIAAGAGVYSVTDEVEGLIIVPPGCLFGIMCTAAGTSHVVQSSIVYEEVSALQAA